MLILGIETSCDDTGAAVVEDGRHIHSNVLSSQLKSHSAFGGIVPEIAARKHVEAIGLMVEEALTQAGISYADLGGIAVTARHGLLRSLVVGVSAAKALAYSLQVPLIGVHHIEGHVYSCMLEHGDAITFPHVCLTVSGGHSLLLLAHDVDRYELIGRTLDDAAGEVYDKVAKYMGLGFPGGPVIDRLAQQGNPHAFAFPRPMLADSSYNMSFSGLKTAVIKEIDRVRRSGQTSFEEDLAASFQQAVIDVLVGKASRALGDRGIDTLTVCGGVAANRGLRAALETMKVERGIQVFYPSIPLCTDNGAMIAGLGFHKLRSGQVSDLRLDAQANAPLGTDQVRYK